MLAGMLLEPSLAGRALQWDVLHAAALLPRGVLGASRRVFLLFNFRHAAAWVAWAWKCRCLFSDDGAAWNCLQSVQQHSFSQDFLASMTSCLCCPFCQASFLQRLPAAVLCLMQKASVLCVCDKD